MTRTVGIDLGTTNSCVATIGEGGKPEIIANRQGLATTPSVVCFGSVNPNEKPLVGQSAQRMAITNPTETVFAVKRLVGRRFDDPEVQALAATLPYHVTAAANGDAAVTAGGSQRSPQEISSLILGELLAAAQARFPGEEIEAIITVPAYFDHLQRQATIDAAAIAGLPVRRLLNEPTAAALGYGAHRQASKRFAICDLGGGTFDVSIVNVEDGVIEVISTHGDLFVGGDDVDRLFIEQIVVEVHREHGVALGRDPTALQRLKEACRNAKHTLSATRTASIHLPFLGKRAGGIAFDYARQVTRDELEQWAAPLIARLEMPCREALLGCGLGAEDIDAVILVGGSTRMPLVQRKFSQIFGREPLKVVNPDEIVSIGAATQCGILDGGIEGVVLLDVLPRTVGLRAAGSYSVVIPRNTAIPAREQKIVATTEDHQRDLFFDLFEGEATTADRNRHLARFAIRNFPDAPAGDVVFVVELTVDVDGLLHVSVTELASGNRPELRLLATAGLRRSDVARLANIAHS